MNPAEYDALVLPGGQINPDKLRAEPKAIEIIRAFYSSGKTVAAICHAPWLLIEAGIIKGKKCTSYHSIKTDVINAGGQWRDETVVTDQGLITSRNPGDLEAFVNKIIEEVREGSHAGRRRQRSNRHCRRETKKRPVLTGRFRIHCRCRFRPAGSPRLSTHRPGHGGRSRARSPLRPCSDRLPPRGPWRGRSSRR